MLRTLLFLVVCTAFASPVDAGISVMGFSGGDDTFTLSAILTQAINQVAVLKNIATFTSDALKDAQFIKDMYDTADDVASGRW